MNKVPDILNTFQTISLPEMENVKLMDRTDTKFTFSSVNLPVLLEMVKEHYFVLAIEGNLSSTYNTLYFDTHDFSIYFKHHNGCLNRYKIRYRQYVESKIGFLEIKFKNNRERTVKERIRQKEVPIFWNEKSLDFVLSKSPYNPHLLLPRLWVNYQRITLVDKKCRERVTIDLNLEYKNDLSSRTMENLVIAEVKQEKRGQSEMIKALRVLKIRPASLSKYCMGITYIYPLIKRNNFKQKLTQLNKIVNDNSFKFASGF